MNSFSLLYFGVETLRSWKGQIKSGGSLLLSSKVPFWVCFCVRRLRWELNPELWQNEHEVMQNETRQTWAVLIPHWHTALSTTSSQRPSFHLHMSLVSYVMSNTAWWLTTKEGRSFSKVSLPVFVWLWLPGSKSNFMDRIPEMFTCDPVTHRWDRTGVL